MNAAVDITRLLPAWEHFRTATGITPIRDEDHYARMVAILEALLSETLGDFLGASWDVLGASWAILWASWGLRGMS